MKIMSRLTALAGLLGSITPTFAITWGEPDGQAHPNVVHVFFQPQQGGSTFRCTGTLLTSSLIVTAGHCTASGTTPNYKTWASNLNPTSLAGLAAVCAGDGNPACSPTEIEQFFDTSPLWSQGTATPHPQFNDFAEFPNTYDIGVVVLSEPINVAEYGTLPTAGQFDYIGEPQGRGPLTDRQVAIVGFGLQGAIPPFSSGVLERYHALSAIINTGKSANAGPQNFIFTNNPGHGGGPGGTCSGDSGGPAFWIDPVTDEETTIIVAVNSYGIAPLCNGNDYQFRTDTPAARSFLDDFIALP